MVHTDRYTIIYLLSCSFSCTRRSSSAKMVIWVLFKCWICWTANRRFNFFIGRIVEGHLLRCNKVTLLIFLFKQAGNSLRKSSKPSLIWARRFCSDWIWIWRLNSLTLAVSVEGVSWLWYKNEYKRSDWHRCYLLCLLFTTSSLLTFFFNLLFSFTFFVIIAAGCLLAAVLFKRFFRVLKKLGIKRLGQGRGLGDRFMKISTTRATHCGWGRRRLNKWGWIDGCWSKSRH